ncbi:MAG: cell envelope integrity protein TolA, partial [Ramlibacter sp.]
MTAAARRLEFAPPPPPGLGRAWGLAMLAHLLLAAALTWGISWRHEDTALAAEAELWSAQVQQAAPPLKEAPPPPPPPAAQAAPAPPPPAPREADIALEREKKRIEQEKKKQEAEKAEAKKKAEAEKKRLEDQKKREAREKADKAQEQTQARAREEAEAQRAEALRQENLRRIQGLAGATGAENATGNATRSSGPSDSYAGRIRARIKPNIVFTDNVTGNPVTEVEVRMAPDGTITSHRVTKSSGIKAWDEAVLRALDRTAILPR